MIGQLKEALKLEDLRKRLVFMVFGFTVFMVGRLIPLAQVDTQLLTDRFGGSDDLFGVFNMFSGGALERLSIFALGVMPYINASIMFQLLTVAVPSLKKLAQEGETGRQQISAYTRWLTVALAILQGTGLTSLLRGTDVLKVSTVDQVMLVLTVTAGSMFVLWLGEQMTERGIGNGVSLMIFIGIMTRLPVDIWQTLRLVAEGGVPVINAVLLFAIMVATVAGVVFIQQGERQIRVQYARRVVGTRMMGGASTYLPMKVNQAGVMPIIFAISVVLFPRTIVMFLPIRTPWWNSVQAFVNDWLTPGTGAQGWFALLLYFILVVAFTYFYTAVTYDPAEVADNLKKWGGQIKGIRAGSETARYIDRVLTRITFAGASFLGIIALMPYLVPAMTGINTFGLVGGTSLLIVVGVALETMQQIDAHLLMRQYKGFIG
ncbi:MAG: preprotein translocase subunit SecY [Armatimonadetes bacterium]|nr:preprotein translocase subunit SecY [Armatimonadota bacterium]